MHLVSSQLKAMFWTVNFICWYILLYGPVILLGYVSTEQKKEVEFGILKLPFYSCVTRSQSWSLVGHQDPECTEELEQGPSGGHSGG